MPKCALNKDTDSPDDWVGSDDDNWLMRWRIKKKHWFAFANRCPKGLTCTIIFFPLLYLVPLLVWFTGWSWWYLWPIGVMPVARKWRLLPTVLFAVKGGGPWRIENTDSTIITSLDGMPNPMFFPRLETSAASVMTPFYLSRIQLFCRWHFAISWPFLIQGHFYFRSKDVEKPSGPHEDKDGKVFSFYRGWHRDEDEIYWGDGGGAGNFK